MARTSLRKRKGGCGKAGRPERPTSRGPRRNGANLIWQISPFCSVISIAGIFLGGGTSAAGWRVNLGDLTAGIEVQKIKKLRTRRTEMVGQSTLWPKPMMMMRSDAKIMQVWEAFEAWGVCLAFPDGRLVLHNGALLASDRLKPHPGDGVFSNLADVPPVRAVLLHEMVRRRTPVGAVPESPRSILRGRTTALS